MSDQRTRIVCDTTAYLPSELVAGNGIELVSLYVNLGGKVQRESEMPDFDDFYDRLRTSEETATTSQPSVGDFIEVYEPLLEDGGEVVSVHLSAGISGTYEAALQAKQRLEEEGRGGERIVVHDSESTCGGMGLCVLAGAALARAGAGGEDVLGRIREARASLRMWFAVDTLEYLRRGGRIGAASAWIGSTLKIKPILTLEAELVPVERVRTSARAFQRMVDYARERAEAGADGWVVQHIQNPEGAGRLIEACRDVFGSDPCFTSEIGPVIGAHAGPGLIGVGGIPSSLLK